MIEALVMGGVVGFYPDSGPGPKTLSKGNADMGFFGEVSSTELLSTSELSDQLMGMVGYTATTQTPVWLKFSYKGKILFIAKDLLYQSLNWQTLYMKGLVYGIDAPGPYNSGTDVNQIVLVKKDTHTFHVRTIQGFDVDPAIAPVSGFDTDYRSCEWTDLMYQVSSQAMTNYPPVKWAQYTNAQLGLTLNNVCQESISGTTTSNISRGLNRVDQIVARTKVYATSAYRPVLELRRNNSAMLSILAERYSINSLTAPVGVMIETIGELQQGSTLLVHIDIIPSTSGVLSAAITSISSETLIRVAIDILPLNDLMQAPNGIESTTQDI